MVFCHRNVSSILSWSRGRGEVSLICQSKLAPAKRRRLDNADNRANQHYCFDNQATSPICASLASRDASTPTGRIPGRRFPQKKSELFPIPARSRIGDRGNSRNFPRRRNTVFQTGRFEAPCNRFGRAIFRCRKLSFFNGGFSSTSLVPASTFSTESPIKALISLAAPALRCARLRTSAATIAKPRPCSPARAASTAAFNARILVWKAMPSITPMMSTIFLHFEHICDRLL